MIDRGRLLVLEGPDGSGKTTLAASYADYLTAVGRKVTVLSFPGRVPGTLGNLIYALHHNPMHYGVKAMTPESAQALHLAAHLDAIDRLIRPRLDRGENIVLDRYWWSTWVYGRDAGANEATLDGLIDTELRHWRDIHPAAVILITRRKSLRPEESADAWNHRMELYLRLANQEAKRYRVRVVNNDTSESDAIDRIVSAASDVFIGRSKGTLNQGQTGKGAR